MFIFAVGVISKIIHWPDQGQEAFPLCFLLVVLSLKFRSLIHFELTFIYHVRYEYSFILLLVDIWFSQQFVRSSFLNCGILGTFVKNQLTVYAWIYFCVPYSVLGF